MFKVSFKDKPNSPAKTVQVFNDKATVVTLKGRMNMPFWFSYVPSKVNRWMHSYENVEFNDIVLDKALIVVHGKAVCSESDTFNPVKGERIAEARAKKRLYRFMINMLRNLFNYYKKILVGDMQINFPTSYKDGIFKELLKYEKLYARESEHLNKLLHEA